MRIATALFLGAFAMGCRPACHVIRAADHICTVVVWTDANGREHRVSMNRDELVMHAREVEMAHGR